jgi:hypothetical protein
MLPVPVGFGDKEHPINPIRDKKGAKVPVIRYRTGNVIK